VLSYHGQEITIQKKRTEHFVVSNEVNGKDRNKTNEALRKKVNLNEHLISKD